MCDLKNIDYCDRIILTDGRHIIRPSNIDGEQLFIGAFKHRNTEESARHIILMYQTRAEDDWTPFTSEEIQNSYRLHNGHGQFKFNNLKTPCGPVEIKNTSDETPQIMPWEYGWIVEGTDGKFYATDAFVNQCYAFAAQKPKRPDPIARRWW